MFERGGKGGDGQSTAMADIDRPRGVTFGASDGEDGGIQRRGSLGSIAVEFRRRASGDNVAGDVLNASPVHLSRRHTLGASQRTDGSNVPVQQKIQAKMHELRLLQASVRGMTPTTESVEGLNSTVSALTKQDYKIRNLEAKVERLTKALDRSESSLLEAKEELAKHAQESITDVGGDIDASALVKDHVQEMRDVLQRQMSQHTERGQKKGEDIEKLVRKVIRLQGKLRDAAKAKEARCRCYEEGAMSLHDEHARLEKAYVRASDDVAMLRVALRKLEPSSGGIAPPKEERLRLTFGEVPLVKATDDEYITTVLQRSSSAELLTQFKKDLATWAKEIFTRQDTTLRSLWTLIDQPKSSANPRMDAHKAIVDCQRGLKMAAPEIGRRVNAFFKALCDREKARAVEVVNEHERQKLENRVSQTTMAVVPDPPVPAFKLLKMQLEQLQSYASAMEADIDQIREERNSMEENMLKCYDSCYDTHMAVYSTFRAVWTHRYRFVENVEDSVRNMAVKRQQGEKKKPGSMGHEFLRKVFVQNADEVLRKDKALLETFQRYMTSDELYRRDMAAAAKQKREEDARKRHDMEHMTVPAQGGPPLTPRSDAPPPSEDPRTPTKRRKSSISRFQSAVKSVGSFTSKHRKQSVKAAGEEQLTRKVSQGSVGGSLVSFVAESRQESAIPGAKEESEGEEESQVDSPHLLNGGEEQKREDTAPLMVRGNSMVSSSGTVRKSSFTVRQPGVPSPRPGANTAVKVPTQEKDIVSLPDPYPDSPDPSPILGAAKSTPAPQPAAVSAPSVPLPLKPILAEAQVTIDPAAQAANKIDVITMQRSFESLPAATVATPPPPALPSPKSAPTAPGSPAEPTSPTVLEKNIADAFPKGSWVEAHNLQRAEWSDLNGVVGVVRGIAQVEGSYRVTVDFPPPFGQLRMKTDNVQRAQAPAATHTAPQLSLPSRMKKESPSPPRQSGQPLTSGAGASGSPVHTLRALRGGPNGSVPNNITGSMGGNGTSAPSGATGASASGGKAGAGGKKGGQAQVPMTNVLSLGSVGGRSAGSFSQTGGAVPSGRIRAAAPGAPGSPSSPSAGPQVSASFDGGRGVSPQPRVGPMIGGSMAGQSGLGGLASLPAQVSGAHIGSRPARPASANPSSRSPMSASRNGPSTPTHGQRGSKRF
eukprot:Hpha_TRINITY_DN15982_c1_g11::TRINITY_DN15982_c1_g11_i1::g.75488::m.75488